MRSSFWTYIKAAFNARPMGMFVAPNWIGVGSIALLGILNPGVWLIGAGLELAYLYALSSNKRFQKAVDGAELIENIEASDVKVNRFLNRLSHAEQERYQAMESRCQAIIEQQRQAGAEVLGDLKNQGEGLGRLLWIYLRLLVSRQAFTTLLREDGSDRTAELTIDAQADAIEKQLRDPDLSDELRRSLTSQFEILHQRAQSHSEAEEKLAFLNAELARIEQQVELIREQSVLFNDPALISGRIDEIAATLSGTSQWMRDQQRVYGQVEDVLEEPPPIVVRE